MKMSRNKTECIRCNSTDLEVLEGKYAQSGEHVSDLWFGCRVCRKESPVFTNEAEAANNMLAQQKRLKQN